MERNKNINKTIVDGAIELQKQNKILKESNADLLEALQLCLERIKYQCKQEGQDYTLLQPVIKAQSAIAKAVETADAILKKSIE